MKKLAVSLAFALAAASALAAEDGAALYKAKCSSCHGPDGKGEVPMGKALKVKSLVGTKLTAAEIERISTDGKPGTKMLAVKGLSAEQQKAVAAHVKGLK
jgi:mono/diheme cytochrome c family protein